MISSDKFYFVLEKKLFRKIKIFEKNENMVIDRNLLSTMENEQLFSLCMIEKKIFSPPL